jgi:hypothetical protein
MALLCSANYSYTELCYTYNQLWVPLRHFDITRCKTQVFVNKWMRCCLEQQQTVLLYRTEQATRNSLIFAVLTVLCAKITVEVSVILWCAAQSLGGWWPTFRNNTVLWSSRVVMSKIKLRYSEMCRLVIQHKHTHILEGPAARYVMNLLPFIWSH